MKESKLTQFYRRIFILINQYIERSLTYQLYDKYICEQNLEKRHELYLSFLQKGKILCDELLKILNDIQSIDEITEGHEEIYRVLAKILPTISQTAIEWLLKSENRNIEQELIRRKKTGLLGSIMFNSIYIFKNESNSRKKERVYITFQLPNPEKKHIVILASVNEDYIPAGKIDEVANKILSKCCVQK